MKPLISVIMAIWNEPEQYIRKSVESIINQSTGDLELIIGNNGPDDEIRQRNIKIIEQYSRDDKRIILINNKKNIYLTNFLNIAIKRSKGQYIARMDGDDVALVDRFKIQLKYLKEKDLDLVSSYVKLIDGEGKEFGEKRPSLEKNLKKQLIKGNPFIVHPTYFGKRKVFTELYNEEFPKAQDYEFLLRVESKGYKIGIVPEHTLKYRIHDKNDSWKRSKWQERMAIKARIYAITRYGYPWYYAIYVLRSAFVYLIPYRVKLFIVSRI